MEMTRKRASIVGIGTIGMVAIAVAAVFVFSGSSSAGSGPVVNGVDQTALQNCIAAGNGNCANTVPGLSACMASHLVCNQAANEKAESARSSAIAAAGAPMTESAAIADAVRGAKGGSASPSAAVAQQMTMKDFEAAASVSPMGVAPTDLVWVVTVHADAVTDGGPAAAPTTVHQYTVVYDAASHEELMTCLGDRCPVQG
jgi:hypothetical protein